MTKNFDGILLGVPNLREAKLIWERFGGRIDYPSGTGEVLFIHPDVGRVRANNRRKDCPRELLTKLRRLARRSPPGRDEREVA
jgi:hypothetical protein